MPCALSKTTHIPFRYRHNSMACVCVVRFVSLLSIFSMFMLKLTIQRKFDEMHVHQQRVDENMRRINQNAVTLKNGRFNNPFHSLLFRFGLETWIFVVWFIYTKFVVISRKTINIDALLESTHFKNQNNSAHTTYNMSSVREREKNWKIVK